MLYSLNSMTHDVPRPRFLDYNNEQTKLIEASGVEVVDLAPAIAQDYLALAYESAWAGILEQEPIDGARFKELLFDERLLSQ